MAMLPGSGKSWSFDVSNLGKTISNLGSSVSSFWDHFRNGESNDVARETNETNYKIAQENLAFQRENLEYQKALQQQIFDREDSAYQRTVNDMRSAGLSPLAMNGTNGAGEAIQTEPMHNDYQMQSYRDSSPLEAFQSAVGMYSNLVSLKQNQQMNEALIRKAEAEASSAENLTDESKLSFSTRLAGLILDNNNKSAGYDGKIQDNAMKRLLNIYQQYKNMDASRQNAYDTHYGLNSSMPANERAFHVAARMSGIHSMKRGKNGDFVFEPITAGEVNRAYNDFMRFITPGGRNLFDTLFGTNASSLWDFSDYSKARSTLFKSKK